MTLNHSLHRWTLAALLASAGAVTFAPMAHADHGSRRWKQFDRGGWQHVDHGSWNHGSWNRGSWSGFGGRMELRERNHVGAGPVFAGLVGGMILGAVLSSHAQPVMVHERVCAPAPPECARDRYYEDAPQVVEPEHTYSRPAPEPEHAYPQPAPEPEHTYSRPAPEPERTYAQPAPVYRYEDGNGERWWDTLDECTDAARGVHGPRVIHVVDDKTNAVVKTLYWKHDHWISDQDRDGSDD